MRLRLAHTQALLLLSAVLPTALLILLRDLGRAQGEVPGAGAPLPDNRPGASGNRIALNAPDGQITHLAIQKQRGGCLLAGGYVMRSLDRRPLGAPHD